MQQQLFNEAPPPGTYVPPKPKAGATPLALVELQRLLDRFKPVMAERAAFECPWLVAVDGIEWSVTITEWMVLAVNARSDEAALVASCNVGFPETIMREWPRSNLHLREANFERLAKPAGAAQWPAPCEVCRGAGWLVCCGDESGPCSECMDYEGCPPCENCEAEGSVLPACFKTLCGQSVNVNLLACAFETLAPAVAPKSRAWIWSHPKLRAICAEGAGWRLMLMGLKNQEKPE